MGDQKDKNSGQAKGFGGLDSLLSKVAVDDKPAEVAAKPVPQSTLDNDDQNDAKGLIREQKRGPGSSTKSQTKQEKSSTSDTGLRIVRWIMGIFVAIAGAIWIFNAEKGRDIPTTPNVSEGRRVDVTGIQITFPAEGNSGPTVIEDSQTGKIYRVELSKYLTRSQAQEYVEQFIIKERNELSKTASDPTFSNSSNERVMPGSPSAPLPAPIPAPPRPEKVAEEKPPVGTGYVFTISQIRYCLFEKIRIESMRTQIHNTNFVERFNARINDYNSRCGEYRYRRGDLQSVQAEAERLKVKLQSEGEAIVAVWRQSVSVEHDKRPGDSHDNAQQVLDFQVSNAEFGVINTTSGKPVFVSTKVVPLVPNQAFGWFIKFQTIRSEITWREELELPMAPRTWDIGERAGKQRIAGDGKTTVTERKVSVASGVISNQWLISPGDPSGAYKIRVYVEGILVKTFEFTVSKPNG